MSDVEFTPKRFNMLSMNALCINPKPPQFPVAFGSVYHVSSSSVFAGNFVASATLDSACLVQACNQDAVILCLL